MKRLLPAALGTAALASLAFAQVRNLTLYEMIEETDRAVFGEIVASSVHRIPSGIEEGDFLYYTRLTIEGRTLAEKAPITAEVCFPGGFFNEEEGHWHSESPTADEVKVGTQIVAFYKWFEGLGGRQPANWLFANHGGVFRTVTGPDGRVVLGRGQGYAVSRNLKLTDLDGSVERIQRDIARAREDR